MPEFEYTGTLPPEYAHFHRLDRRAGEAESIHAHERYVQAYHSLWTTWMMQLDRPAQQAAVSNLKTSLRSIPFEDHPQLIQQYQGQLESDSLFPFYQSNQARLRRDRYPEKVITKLPPLPRLPDNEGRYDNSAANYLIEAADIYPHFGDRVLKMWFLGYNGTTDRIRMSASQHVTDFFKQLHSYGITAKSDLGQYITLLKALQTSRAISTHPIRSQISQQEQIKNQTLKSRFENPEMRQKKVLNFLLNTEPYFYASGVLAGKVEEMELAQFGEPDSLEAQLWKMATYMRTSELSKPMTATKARAPLLGALIEGKLEEGSQYTFQLAQTYPGIYHEFALRDLAGKLNE